ncbi:unnamed protein product [Moneuplotes crassus]|uniref:Uncharacterized protein n=1 Tax=Euplotes crassus TaxID=5936 RepID=A0AAD1X3Y0_EUPCR|nr:unnamed protein product [Moneuplotes crassus]
MAKGEVIIGDSSSDEEETKQNVAKPPPTKKPVKKNPPKQKERCIGDISSEDEAPSKKAAPKQARSSKPAPKKEVLKEKTKPKRAHKPEPEKKVEAVKKNIVKAVMKSGCIGDSSSDEDSHHKVMTKPAISKNKERIIGESSDEEEAKKPVIKKKSTPPPKTVPRKEKPVEKKPQAKSKVDSQKPSKGKAKILGDSSSEEEPAKKQKVDPKEKPVKPKSIAEKKPKPTVEKAPAPKKPPHISSGVIGDSSSDEEQIQKKPSPPPKKTEFIGDVSPKKESKPAKKASEVNKGSRGNTKVLGDSSSDEESKKPLKKNPPPVKKNAPLPKKKFKEDSKPAQKTAPKAPVAKKNPPTKSGCIGDSSSDEDVKPAKKVTEKIKAKVAVLGDSSSDEEPSPIITTTPAEGQPQKEEIITGDAVNKNKVAGDNLSANLQNKESNPQPRKTVSTGVEATKMMFEKQLALMMKQQSHLQNKNISKDDEAKDGKDDRTQKKHHLKIMEDSSGDEDDFETLNTLAKAKSKDSKLLSLDFDHLEIDKPVMARRYTKRKNLEEF